MIVLLDVGPRLRRLGVENIPFELLTDQPLLEFALTGSGIVETCPVDSRGLRLGVTQDGGIA